MNPLRFHSRGMRSIFAAFILALMLDESFGEIHARNGEEQVESPELIGPVQPYLPRHQADDT